MVDDDGPSEKTPDGELEQRIREREDRIRRMKSELERADAAKRVERREQVTTTAKVAAIAVGALLLVAGGAWGVSELSKLGPERCNFHEHASFRVVDEGQELSFQHPRFDMQHMAMRAHLHQPNDWMVHLEGGCASVRDFFSLMGMEIRPDYLRLPNELHGGRVLEEDGNRTFHFSLYHRVDGNWTWQEYPGLLNHELREQQRMLVAYGNYTDEEIAALQARVTEVGQGAAG